MYIDVNGTRLFFDVEGAGLVPDGPRMRQKPTLVLLHGGPGLGIDDWGYALGALALEGHSLLLLNGRGAGRSPLISP